MSPRSDCTLRAARKRACTGAAKPASSTWNATRSPTVKPPCMMRIAPSPRMPSCATSPATEGTCMRASVMRCAFTEVLANCTCSPSHFTKSAPSCPPALMLSMLESPPVAMPESLPACTERSREMPSVTTLMRRSAAQLDRRGTRRRCAVSPASRRSIRARKKTAVRRSSTRCARSAETVSATCSFSSTREAISPGERCT